MRLDRSAAYAVALSAAVALSTGCGTATVENGDGVTPTPTSSVTASASPQPVETEPSTPDVDGMSSRVTEVSNYIKSENLTEEQAATYAESAGLTTRVIERDGEPLPVTKDYREDRLNLFVSDGIVTDVVPG